MEWIKPKFWGGYNTDSLCFQLETPTGLIKEIDPEWLEAYTKWISGTRGYDKFTCKEKDHG